MSILCLDEAQDDAVTRTAPDIHVGEMQFSVEHARELWDLLDVAGCVRSRVVGREPRRRSTA